MGDDSARNQDAQSSTGSRGTEHESAALTAFEEAAVTWAGTGFGRALVDAAVDALAAGLDTPTLRVLAGAPARFADEEATEYAPDTFEELGLAVPEKHSEESYLALAELRAKRFLAGEGSARALTIDLWQLYQQSGYRSELADFAGMDDWYVMLDDRVIQGDTATVDSTVRDSAERLVKGLPSQGSRLGGAFLGQRPTPPKKLSVMQRVRSWVRVRARL